MSEKNEKTPKEERQELIKALLKDPENLIQKKPFTRGSIRTKYVHDGEEIQPYATVKATIPQYKMKIVPQERFLDELDPNCHDVLFDDNIPSFCMKLNDGSVREIKYTKLAIPFQRIIKNKKLLHLSAMPMQFTLSKKCNTKEEQENFVTFKEYWDLRNQDGMKTKMVDTQFSVGDAGLLFYIDYKNEIKSRLISFKDGFVICSHNDNNGDRLMESIYYAIDETEYIDSYDDTYMYRHTNKTSEKDTDTSGWSLQFQKPHGFSEIPLVTKRGLVAWNDAQSLIEQYESLNNVFNVIQKKWGFGLIFMRGQVATTGSRIAGNIVLQDTSIDGSGDAKFLDPPSPQSTIDTLDSLKDSIQEASGCTFILPKDIKTSGDVSGIAVQLTQSLDLETAKEGVVDWQNVADKMTRLFKEGLAIELVSKGISKTAITDFDKLKINSKFVIWQPFSKSEYNQMLTTMVNAGILSKESAIELNTESKPDEKARVIQEEEEKIQKEIEAKEREIELNKKSQIQNPNPKPQPKPKKE